MQGLPPAKARKLQAASAVQTVKDLLGSHLDQTTRSLMVALERMGSAEATKCSQALVNKIIAKYGTRGTEGLPLEAESLLSGLITFGSTVEGDQGDLSSMDRFFVENRWTTVEPLLPSADDDAGRGHASSSAGSISRTTSTTSGTVTELGQETVTRLPAQLGVRHDHRLCQRWTRKRGLWRKCVKGMRRRWMRERTQRGPRQVV